MTNRVKGGDIEEAFFGQVTSRVKTTKFSTIYLTLKYFTDIFRIFKSGGALS